MSFLDPQRLCVLSVLPVLVCAWYSFVISMYLPSLTPHNLGVLTVLATQYESVDRDDGNSLVSTPAQQMTLFQARDFPNICDVRFRSPHLTLTYSDRRSK